MQSTTKIWAALALGLTLGCGSSRPEGAELGPAPRAFPGFPPLTHQDTIIASARYDADSARTFAGVDLVKGEGVLPVKMTFRLRGEGASQKVVMVEPSRIDLRLYLPDGTALVPADPDRLAERLSDKRAERVRGEKLVGAALNEAADHEGYVFFQLKPAKDFYVDGRRATHVSGGIEREFDLTHSIVAFDLSVEGETRSLYVGLQ